MRRPLLALLTLALTGGPALAQPTAEAPPPPPPPEAESPPAAGDGPLEPEIRTTTRGTEIHEEYRYNGILYRVRVIPRNGPPYWLIYDELGHVHRSDAEPKLLVPQWVIKRF